MFICPISGCRLVRAQLKGGLLWYSPETDGRLITLATVKHYLGEHAANEIWMRSENAPEGKYGCPGCGRKMVQVQEPRWVGNFELDVCRPCWMIWVDHDDHPEIPAGSDIDANVEAIKKRVAPLSAAVIADQQASATAEPDQLMHQILGLFLPTKTTSRGFPFITVLIISASILAHGFFQLNSIGEKIVFSLNFYFFYLFGSDLEYEISKTKFLLALCVAMLPTFLMLLLGKGDSLRLDFMPINFCFMTMAIFLPLNARFSYLFPAVHYFSIRPEAFFARVFGFRWIHLPQWLVILVYAMACIPIYFLAKDAALALHWRILAIIGIILGLFLGVLFSRMDLEK